MANIVLIWPNDAECYKFSRKRIKRFPLGLGYIAAAAEQVGHDVRIVDGSLDELSVDEIVNSALSHNPKFIGIGFTTPLYNQSCDIVAKCKQQAPVCKIVGGGAHITALPIATLETSQIDIAVLHEGEQVFPRILSGESLYNIPSIAFKNDSGIHVTKGFRYYRKQLQNNLIDAPNLNDYPIPARHLFDNKRYGDMARDVKGAQTGAVFSRGCPGKCAFCGAANTLVRWRTNNNILDELEEIQILGIPNVFVMDDTYTNGKKRVIDLSHGMMERRLNLTYSVQLRLDQIDKEVCDAMYESGVRYVGPGVESGNEQIMKAIGKGLNESKDNIRRKVELLKCYDWTVRCSYVMGMVGETEEQIMDTIKFAEELGADENAFSILVPYPDSPLWSLAKQLGKAHDEMDFDKFLYYGDVGCNLSAVPTKRLLELHKFAYEYAGNPAYKLKKEDKTCLQ